MNVWIGIKATEANRYKYQSDGKDMAITNFWASDAPRDSANLCVSIYKGYELYDTGCDQRRGYVCIGGNDCRPNTTTHPSEMAIVPA